MKKIKALLFGVSFLILGFQSCDLEEYNPGGTTANAVFQTPEGINTLVNSAYVYWGGQFYGREDILMLTEGGTDLWINIANSGYGRQMTKYQELSSSTGQMKNTWNRLYEIINYCNAGIDRIGTVNFIDANEKASREGELHFLRAYAYWHLVEQFGNVDLRTAETQSPILKCYRSPMLSFYDLMLDDLEIAIDKLPINPYPTTDVGRATKKAAYGLKARVALTRVSYEDSQTEKDKYYEVARTAATYVIDHQSELNVSLYGTPSEVFAPGNNKKNKEAMFVVTHSTISSLNANSSNPNRLHLWFKAKYSGKAGMVMDLNYGADKNSKSGGMCFMPTRYLLEIYDEAKDARYNAWFREKYYLNTEMDYTWTADELNYFGKPASMVGQKIKKGELALWFTKQKVADKREKPYAVVDVDDVYNGENVSTNATFNIHFPTLTKYDDPDLPTVGSNVGSKDVIVMRLAEMYFIAAECDVMMTNGNKTEAKELINVIRRRAAAPGKQTDMEVSESDMNLDFILEEKAREFCGEHLRWFDLKRTNTLYARVKKYNKDIPLIQEYHRLRPIPKMFLDAILNASEFGQNEGYN